MVSVGAEILQLITLGMYGDPLAIYREYIQNSADSFALSGLAGGSVRITVNRSDSSIAILDDGPGLSPEQAARALLPIAQSGKSNRQGRGFRGIGRLAGLAFADSVTFLTRSRPDEPITRVFWDGAKISSLRQDSTLDWAAIRDCVVVDTVRGIKRPGRFFEARIEGIGRHAAGIVLNERRVRNYIGEVCPVPMSQDFSRAEHIASLFRPERQPLTLHVEFDGDPAPVTRPHCNAICFSDHRHDAFTEFERSSIPSLRGNEPAAVGWVLHSSYLGAIPKGLGIRGIRARMGNIQVGNESAFDHLFSEERFNRWCVGEIHVLDPAITPNARRDYFEPGPHLRNFENHVAAICGKVADRCRSASKSRNRKRKLQSLLQDADDACELVNSGYLSAEDAASVLDETKGRIRQARAALMKLDSNAASEHALLDEAEARLNPGPPGQNGGARFEAGEAIIYQKIFGALAAVARSPGAAKEMIDAVLMETGHAGR